MFTNQKLKGSNRANLPELLCYMYISQLAGNVKDITEMSIQIKQIHNGTWYMHFSNTNKFFAAPKPPGNTTACATLDDS